MNSQQYLKDIYRQLIIPVAGYTQSILPEIRAIPCLDQIAADDSTRSHHTPNGDLLLPEGKNSDSADHSFRGILPGEASTEEGADGSMTTSKSLSRRSLYPIQITAQYTCNAASRCLILDLVEAAPQLILDLLVCADMLPNFDYTGLMNECSEKHVLTKFCTSAGSPFSL